MKKIVYPAVSFAILCFIQYKFLGKYLINLSVLSDYFTFLSIIFGFYITSLAIFVTSKYVGGLYKFVDKENNSITLLHRLIYNYQNGLKINLFTIGYILIIMFIISQTKTEKVALSSFYLIPLGALIIFNFGYSYKMLRDLINVILQEAKRNPN